MADRSLLRRSHPLISLHLKLCNYCALDASFISSLLSKAHSLGLNHLTIEGFGYYRLSPVLNVLFSMDTLKSLSLDGLPNPLYEGYMFPSEITLTCLRSLSLELYDINPAIVNLLLSKLCSLQDLQLHLYCMPKLILSSRSIRNLKLFVHASIPNLNTVELFLPSLESLHLKTEGKGPQQSPLHIYGEIPLLKKAVIALYELPKRDVDVVHQLLNCFSHVEELALHIKESVDEKHPIPILLKPGKDVPNFLNLRHLDVTVCFHGHNLDAVATMLNHSPTLKSLNLVHEVPKFTWVGRGRKRKYWGSKLPRNDDGNYRYAHIRNLHLGDNRKGFMKRIRKKCASRERQTCS